MMFSVAHLDWQDSGLCTQIGMPDMWFPPKGGAGVTAKRICARCPVKAECDAFGANEPDGFWGGRSPIMRGVR